MGGSTTGPLMFNDVDNSCSGVRISERYYPIRLEGEKVAGKFLIASSGFS